QLSFGLDFHSSSAENLTTTTEMGLNANIATANFVDWSREMPLMSVEFNDGYNRVRGTNDGVETHNYMTGNGNGVIDGGDVSGAMTNNLRSNSRTEIDHIQLFGEYQFNGSGFFENSGVKFGFEQRKDVNSSLASGDNRQGVGNWDGVDPALFPDQYFESRDFGDDFPDYGSTTNDPGFFTGVDADLFKLIEAAEHINSLGAIDPALAADFYGFFNCKVQWYGIYATNRTIEEESK